MSEKKAIYQLLKRVDATYNIQDLEELRDNIMTSEGSPKAKYFVLKAIDMKLDPEYNKKALIEDGEYTLDDSEMN